MNDEEDIDLFNDEPEDDITANELYDRAKELNDRIREAEPAPDLGGTTDIIYRNGSTSEEEARLSDLETAVRRANSPQPMGPNMINVPADRLAREPATPTLFTGSNITIEVDQRGLQCIELRINTEFMVLGQPNGTRVTLVTEMTNNNSITSGRKHISISVDGISIVDEGFVMVSKRTSTERATNPIRVEYEFRSG